MASSINKFGKNKVFPKCTLTRQPDHIVNIQNFTSSFQQFPTAVLIFTDKSYSTFRPNPVYIYLLVPLVIKLPAPLIANTGSQHWQGNSSLRWSLQAPPTPTENRKFHPLWHLVVCCQGLRLEMCCCGRWNHPSPQLRELMHPLLEEESPGATWHEPGSVKPDVWRRR